jgi:L-cystine transport system permease protein
MYKFSFQFFGHEIMTAVSYIPITLLLALTPLVVGVLLGFILAVCRVQKIPVAARVIQIYITVFRSLPMVLTIVILYYFFQYGLNSISGALHLGITSAKVPPLAMALIVLCIISVAFITESIRTALQSVQKGQIEAALSIGMTTRTTYRRVIIPQALPVAVPILGNTFIGLVKGTALAYMLGVTDLVTGVKIEANASYRYIEAYIAIALIYWAICILIERLVKLLSKRVNSINKGEILDRT